MLVGTVALEEATILPKSVTHAVLCRSMELWKMGLAYCSLNFSILIFSKLTLGGEHERIVLPSRIRQAKHLR